MMVRTLLVAVSLVVLVAGCGGKSDKTEQVSANPPAQDAQAQSASAPGTTHGEVTETMDSGGYTYVHVKTAEGDVWAAGPVTAVAVGDEVTLPSGMVMKDFESKTLNRTFDEILFVSAIQKGNVQPTASAPSSMPSMPGMGGGNPHTGLNQAAVTVAAGSIAKATGGMTIAQIYADKSKLAGHEVTVRGQVVKCTSNVMGKNWLHIQDGSSTGADGDLTVTTDANAKVGDVVLVKGILATGKDFGAGYAYDVIIENANVSHDAL